MTRLELQNLLTNLLSLPAETEVVEFKEANKNYDFSKLGKYFSALSNEANLKDKKQAWLVFGVNNSHKIVGTQFRINRKDLDHLKQEIAEKINNRLTFREIYELDTESGRVILFEIPPALSGNPTPFEGHAYGRDGESLGALNQDEYNQILNQSKNSDWSIEVCIDASISDLDPVAITKAREKFKIKNPRLSSQVDLWDDTAFLNKAKLTINNQITNTAILLLGKSESEHYISPAIAKMTWILKDLKNNEKDYQHFSCPFILTIDELFTRIRNLKYRYILDGTLFPDEVDRYDAQSIREAINNCIAHQDYSLSSRISVVEIEDEQLIFTNAGSFLPGSIDSILNSDQPSIKYRNRFLVDAMVNLDMIDTIGHGIKNMFKIQRSKYFPLPDFDLSNNLVKLNITGKVLDLEYARVLARNPNLTLNEIILLDKVQKKKELLDDEISILKKKKLIEGRKPNFHISESVANKTKQLDHYIKTKGLDKKHYMSLLTEFISLNKKGCSKEDLRLFMIEKLPDMYIEKQKETKLSNLLTELKKQGKIENQGSDKKPNWQIKK